MFLGKEVPKDMFYYYLSKALNIDELKVSGLVKPISANSKAKPIDYIGLIIFFVENDITNNISYDHNIFTLLFTNGLELEETHCPFDDLIKYIDSKESLDKMPKRKTFKFENIDEVVDFIKLNYKKYVPPILLKND